MSINMDFDNVVMKYHTYKINVEQFNLEMWRYAKEYDLEDIKITTSERSPTLFIEVYCDNEKLKELFEKHKKTFIRKFNLKQISHKVIQKYKYKDKKIIVKYTFVNKSNNYFEEEKEY